MIAFYILLLEFNKVEDDDWYISRGRYQRIDLLKILYVGKDMVCGKSNINKKLWNNNIDICSAAGSSVINITIEWKAIREVLKCMFKK